MWNLGLFGIMTSFLNSRRNAKKASRHDFFLSFGWFNSWCFFHRNHDKKLWETGVAAEVNWGAHKWQLGFVSDVGVVWQYSPSLFFCQLHFSWHVLPIQSAYL